MASLSDLRRYLPQDEGNKNLDELTELIDRANTTESAIRILNDELHCNIPELGHGTSIKIMCPWSLEHSDPLDKNCRFYFGSDHGYCFALHGVLDPVFLRSMMWQMSKPATARRMLEAAGLMRRAPWHERLAETRARMEAPQVPVANQSAAHAALMTALKARTDYTRAQYKPETRTLVQEALDEFDPLWDMDAITAWIEKYVTKIGTTLA